MSKQRMSSIRFCFCSLFLYLCIQSVGIMMLRIGRIRLLDKREKAAARGAAD